MWVPLFVVWRESVEALLVIGILYTWLQRENMQWATNRLWLGTGLGLLIAFILAAVIMLAGDWYAGEGGDWLMAAMLLIASLLILQMVVWMHRHGSGMKHKLESEMSASFEKSGATGVVVLSMLAVAREGTETVAFLSGPLMSLHGGFPGWFILGAVLGLIAALITFYLLQKSSHIISWKWFFRISSFVLLLLGGAMMVQAVDRFASLLLNYYTDLIPEWADSILYTPLWNSAWLIPDNDVLISLTGYHAEPSFIQVLALGLYWAVAILIFNKGKDRSNPMKSQAA